MKRLLVSILFFLSMALTSFLLSACNTFEGMGKDMQETGDVFSYGPDAAYHQNARDF